MAQSPVPLGEVFAGKYRVDRVLGEGGMGIVVAAHHLELDQPVAIKFLLDDLAQNQEGAERFRREARAAAKIQSDHVVRVLDVGLLDSGVRYMVMEFLRGRDLAEEIETKGALPIATAVTYLIEALDAVGQAHGAGIVHRDLKPANLFLAERPDGSTRVKVLDFGISKTFGKASASELSLTKTSAWIGSPLYMSPEQMQSARDVDHRADIWSMGAILYEMLAGQPPYLAESLPQLVNLLLTRDADPVILHRSDVPAELSDVVMKCLVRDPAGRMQSAGELVRELAPFAGPFAAARLSRLPAPVQLDRTELGPGPASLARPSVGAATPALGSGVPAETVSGHSASVPASAATATGGKSRGLVVAALGAVVLAGGGLAFALRPSDEPPASPLAPVTATPVSAAPPVAAPVASPPSAPSTAAPTAAAPPAAASAPEAASAAPAGATPDPTKPLPKAKPKPKPAATSTTTTTGSGDLSEFGGRR